MRAKLRGTEIYFDIAGMQLIPGVGSFESRPVLFVLHGGPGGDHIRFKYHSLELQDVAQLVFIDNRGCGRSKKSDPEEYTLENNIEDIEALRQHLGLEKICILGTSYGGMVAQGYAIRYPHCVTKLILVATSPSYRFINEAKNYLQEHGSKEQIAFCEHLWQGTFRDSEHVNQFFKIMEPLYCLHPNNFPIPKLTTVWSYEALNKGFSGILREFDFIPDLNKISCPTLVLGGEDDWISRPSQQKVIAERIPLAELKMFKDCGHSVAIDAHEDYINIIKQFLLRKVQ